VRAVPIGSVTGKGGDIVIFDDPHNVADWQSSKKKRNVIQQYETLRTRGNKGDKTQFLIVGHRTAFDDVFAHINEGGDFHSIVLPLYAPKDMHFKIGDHTWVLRKGEALRPDISQAEIEKLRAGSFGGPPFWLHFQQGLGPKEIDVDIDVNHFPFFKGEYTGKPVVISVDPASKTNSSSRNAIHVYAVCDGLYVLLDAFAEACTFRKLLRQVRQFASRYGASLILVEETGRGGDLIEDLRSQTTVVVEAVKQPRGPKLSRFREILPLIRAKKVHVVKGKDSVEQVVDELVTFPNSEFDDHVDTLVNFLKRMLSQKPIPDARIQNRASVGVALGSEPRGQSKEPVRGIAVVLGSRR
jgi:predicted phage terminase large subunit-like protein